MRAKTQPELIIPSDESLDFFLKKSSENNIDFAHSFKISHTSRKITGPKMPNIKYSPDIFLKTNINSQENSDDDSKKTITAKEKENTRQFSSIQVLQTKSQINNKNFKNTKEKCLKFIDFAEVQFLMTLLWIYVLFEDNLRSVFFNIKADEYFEIIRQFCFAMFLIELTINCFTKHKYTREFYFFIKSLALLSIFLDCGFLRRIFATITINFYPFKIFINFLSVLKIVRIQCILQYFFENQIANFSCDNLEQFVEMQNERKKKIIDYFRCSFDDKKLFFDWQNSKLAHQLKNKILRNLCLVLIILIFAIPLFEMSNYELGPSRDLNMAFNFLYPLISDTSLPNIEKIVRNLTFSYPSANIVHISKNNQTIYEHPNFYLLRLEEKISMNQTIIEQNYSNIFQVVFSNRFQMVFESKISGLRLLFYLIVLYFCLNHHFKIYHAHFIKKLEEIIYNIRRFSSKEKPETDINKNPENDSFLILNESIFDILKMGQKTFEASNFQSMLVNVFKFESTYFKFQQSSKVFGIFAIYNIQKKANIIQNFNLKIFYLINEVANIVHEQVADKNTIIFPFLSDCFMLVWKLGHLIVEQEKEMTIKIKGFSTKRKIVKSLKLTDDKIELVSDECENVLQKFSESLIVLSKNQSKILGASRINPLLKISPINLAVNIHIGFAFESLIGTSSKMNYAYNSADVSFLKDVHRVKERKSQNIIISETFYDFLNESGLKMSCHEIFLEHEINFESEVKFYGLSEINDELTEISSDSDGLYD